MGQWIYSSTILDLGTRWRWLVSFMPLPLWPRGKSPGTHWKGGWGVPRGGLDAVKKRKFLILPGLELRPLGRPARSQSLYRLSYPGSWNGKGQIRKWRNSVSLLISFGAIDRHATQPVWNVANFTRICRLLAGWDAMRSSDLCITVSRLYVQLWPPGR
jgi:hypothetical protein